MNYEDLANKAISELPVEKILPEGSWLLRGRSATLQPPTKEDGSPSVLFVYSVKEPMSDVRDEDLQALADDGTPYDYTQNTIFNRFWIQTPKDKEAVLTHLEKHGVEVDRSKPIPENLAKFKGTEVVAVLGIKSFQDQQGNLRVDNNASMFTRYE